MCLPYIVVRVAAGVGLLAVPARAQMPRDLSGAAYLPKMAISSATVLASNW